MRIALHSHTTTLDAHLSDPTKCATFSSWTFSKAYSGGVGYVGGGANFTRPATSATVKLLSGAGDFGPGTYYLTGLDATTDHTYLDLAGNQLFRSVLTNRSNKMVVKYDSKLTLTSATRYRSHVTLSAQAKRWAPDNNNGKYVRWSKAVVSVQKAVRGGWKTVAILKTTRAGTVAVRVKASPHSTWRLVSSDTASIWGHTTASKSR